MFDPTEAIKYIDSLLSECSIEDGKWEEYKQELIRQQSDGWIKVKDDLPKEGKTVIAWDGDCIMVSYFDHGCFFDSEYTEKYRGITHWMVRPAPPKGEDSE